MLLLISLPAVVQRGDSFITVSVNGLYHGWEYITLIIALAIVVYLVLCAGFQELPSSSPVRTMTGYLFMGTGINFVLVLLGFLIRPGQALAGARRIHRAHRGHSRRGSAGHAFRAGPAPAISSPGFVPRKCPCLPVLQGRPGHLLCHGDGSGLTARASW